MPQTRPQCARRGPSPPQKKGAHSPIFGPCLLWPKGWMDQDATWCEGTPRPRPYCVTWGPSSPPMGHSRPSSSPPKKGAQQPPPVFGPCLLWPKGWMDQDSTWYGGRPRRMPRCVRWETSPPPSKGALQPLLLAHIYCDHGRPSQLLSRVDKGVNLTANF